MYGERQLKKLFKSSVKLIEDYSHLLEDYTEIIASHLCEEDKSVVINFLLTIQDKSAEGVYEDFYYELETITRDAVIKLIEFLISCHEDEIAMLQGEALMNGLM